MSDRPWHKRYHSDALTGMIGLTLEERGAFQTVLDMIYDRGGPIPDNDRLLSSQMGVTPRKWRSLKTALIGHGKIAAWGGLIGNQKALLEIEEYEKMSRKRAENGAKGGRKTSEHWKKIKESNGRGEASALGYQKLEARYTYPDNHLGADENPFAVIEGGRA